MTTAHAPSTAPSALETVAAACRTRGVDAGRVVTQLATLAATGQNDRSVAARGLPHAASETLYDEVLALHGVLGSGGMGEVLEGEQSGLRRLVAVKRPRDSEDVDVEAALRKEAWVGAHVEHPNVVPVHALVRLPGDGRPGLVMQRVSGRPWTDSLSLDGSAEHGRLRLERALDVLVRVCNAVAFAHARGVLHLDLKPDNVMVGDADEVYVLDWGLAVGFGPDAPAWLPRADAIDRVVGTPAYMPPERITCDGAHVGPRSDVYLLGGLLHHILTGEPPHRGEDLLHVFAAAFADDKGPYPGDAPPALVSLATDALRADPSSRIGDVATFRARLDAAIRTLPGDRMVVAVEARIDVLEGDAERDTPFFEAELAECEIAIGELRRTHATHPTLPSLAERTVALRLRAGERDEDPAGIERTLARVDVHLATLPPALRARRDALADRLEARVTELRALEELSFQLDAGIGARERIVTWRILGATWCLCCLVFGAAGRHGWFTVDYGFLFRESVAIALVIGVAFAALRAKVLRNKVNRRLAFGLTGCAVIVELLLMLCAVHGVPVETALGLTCLMYTYYFLSMAIAVDRRVVPGAVCFAVAAVVAFLAPGWVHEALGVAGLGTVLAVTSRWARGTRVPA